jgi:hypothetical protein
MVTRTEPFRAGRNSETVERWKHNSVTRRCHNASRLREGPPVDRQLGTLNGAESLPDRRESYPALAKLNESSDRESEERVGANSAANSELAARTNGYRQQPDISHLYPTPTPTAGEGERGASAKWSDRLHSSPVGVPLHVMQSRGPGRQLGAAEATRPHAPHLVL